MSGSDEEGTARTNGFHDSSFPQLGFPEAAEVNDPLEWDERRSVGDLFDECGIVRVIAIDDELLVAAQSPREGCNGSFEVPDCFGHGVGALCSSRSGVVRTHRELV